MHPAPMTKGATSPPHARALDAQVLVCVVDDDESMRESLPDLLRELGFAVQAFASASGTASDDATVFVGLPSGRSYEQPEMLVVVSPTLRRMLVDLALDRDAYALDRRLATCILPAPPNTTADRASDLLAATSALEYLRSTKRDEAPEALRLSERIRGLVAELIGSQNSDGGWAWVGDGRKRFIFGLDQCGAGNRLSRRFRHHEGHAVADMAGTIGRQHNTVGFGARLAVE